MSEKHLHIRKNYLTLQLTFILCLTLTGFHTIKQPRLSRTSSRPGQA